MLRHIYGYSDILSTSYAEKFQFYITIGDRQNPCCLTPYSRQDSDIPYFRDYSEAIETRLYFRGFSLDSLKILSRRLADGKSVGDSNLKFCRVVSCH